jgi:hypothetical protein
MDQEIGDDGSLGDMMDSVKTYQEASGKDPSA